jgi:photosystem II stability/assembly factor-like uncharacterized protein
MGHSSGSWYRRLVSPLVLVSALTLAGPAVALGAGWDVQPAVTSEDLNAVELAANAGWAVGAGGTILSTRDGGAHWSKRTIGSAWLSGVSFAGALTGWVAGGTSLLGTSDGGSGWAPQTLPGIHTVAVSAVDDRHAWAAGSAGADGVILTTADGQTWSAQYTAEDAVLCDISFTDLLHGCAVGYDGAILTTEDGGGTWTVRDAGCDAALAAVCFFDAEHGWAAGTLGTGIYASRAVLLATDDGGKSWARAYTSTSTGAFFSVARIDEARGWAVGTFGGVPNAVVVTNDGGATWRLQGVAPRELADVGMTDALHGCAVGDAGLVLTTRTGGSSADRTPPVTSVRGAGHGWRRRWVLRFAATDGTVGSGVACVQASTRAAGRWHTGRVLVLASGDDHRYDGAHTVYYRAVDAAGNIEAERSCVVRIDTRPPKVQSAGRMTVAAGAPVRLAYRIVDRGPGSGRATCRLSVIRETASGFEMLVRNIRIPLRRTGVWRALTLRAGLPAGSYLCSFSATDTAGNMGAGPGTRLVVTAPAAPAAD